MTVTGGVAKKVGRGGKKGWEGTGWEPLGVQMDIHKHNQSRGGREFFPCGEETE